MAYKNKIYYFSICCYNYSNNNPVMGKNKSDKKISILETSFEDVLICKKESAKTLLEIFTQEPENVAQENLGKLAGILEITDDSPDSSYIVNYLVSVLKKEYYSKTKRGSIESFESALNKANLALAKLAEHGNVNWLGKINAIILAIEKNNIHLSQAGNARTFLLRGKAFTDITDGAQSIASPSPFKTFIDVLSGRLEKDDQLIITTDAIFEIFSSEEIKRSALKFSPPDFIRFLKTALGNELEKSAVLIARIEEKELLEKKSVSPKNEDLNAFSQASFAKKYPPQQKQEPMAEEEKKSLVKEIKEDLQKESAEFIDKKTGHIYIKESYSLKEKNIFWENTLEISRVKLAEFYAFLTKRMANLKQKIVSYKFFNKIETAKEEPISPTEAPPTQKEPQKPLVDKEKLILLFKEIILNVKNISLAIFSFSLFAVKKILLGIKTFIPKKINSSEKRVAPLLKKDSLFEKIRPRFSKIKETFFKLDQSQKIYAALAIMLLLIVPYFIAKIQNKNISEEPVFQEIAPENPLPLEQDKNVSRIENLQSVFSQADLVKIINLNGKIFFIDKNKLTNAEDKQSYSFPTDFSSLKIAFPMNDLNLIFLMNQNNRIISWSPLSKKFQENVLAIPAGAEISLAETYLTYLYLLDKNHQQIYRYPRATGGFGEKTNWLKDDIDLKEISDIAIGENIFLAQNGEILKFFQGKKQNFTLEKTATPIFADQLYTQRDSQNLFVLDKKNSRLVKLDLNGNIVSQFYNTEISSATDFEINEESNLAFFSNNNEVKSFEMR